jgi:hypothetical protein
MNIAIAASIGSPWIGASSTFAQLGLYFLEMRYFMDKLNLPASFFRQNGEGYFEPTEATIGPWSSDLQHGSRDFDGKRRDRTNNYDHIRQQWMQRP